MPQNTPLCVFFFFNDTATTEIYTLSLHDALPILAFGLASCTKDGRCRDPKEETPHGPAEDSPGRAALRQRPDLEGLHRSEEHTSELQSPCNLVCRLLLEKKKKIQETIYVITR